MEENNPLDTLVEGENVTPANGNGDAETTTSDAMTLRDLLKSATGREYPDDETALKAIKDTYAFVGEAGKAKKDLEALRASGSPDLVSTLTKRLDEAEFFSENPDLKPHKDILSTFATAKGISIADAAKLEDVKSVISKVKGYDEVENSKSVLQSNPKIAIVRNKAEEAKTALKDGDISTARSKAVGSVLDAFES